MFRRSPFHHRQSTVACVVALLFVIALAMTKASATRSIRSLTFEDRVAAQRAIEAVYHQQRIWPKDNPQPKPSLDEVLPESALRAKVTGYLRMSRALEVLAGAPLTPAQLQAELERMARQTRQPAVLGVLWAAQTHDTAM